MNNVRDTSLESYNTLRENKTRLCDKQMQVYEVIKDNIGVSDQEIADILGWRINCVTGRRNEIEKDFKLIKSLGKKKNYNNRSVHMWGLV